MDDKPDILVAVSTSDKLYARFLRYVTKSRYHHSLIFIYLKQFGGWMALDIDPDGVHIVSTKKAFKRITRFKCFRTEANLHHGLAETNECLGLEYDRKGLFFGLIFLFLKRFFGIIPDKPIHSADKMYCIEYVATVLQKAGISAYRNVDPAMIPPDEHYKKLCRDGAFIRYDISKEELLNRE